MVIPGFSNYKFLEGKVVNIKTGKEVTLTTTDKSPNPYCKLKTDEGVWKSISLAKVVAICNPPQPPDNSVLVPGYTKTYVNKEGKVWVGPGKTTPLGTVAATSIDSGTGYVVVTTEKGTKPVHQLLALAFIDSLYLEKGLCVMHLDNDKTNHSLNNLKIGTYSENNQHAYDTGANMGPTKQRKLN